MITNEMLDYIGLFSKKSLIYALKNNDKNGNYKGISRTVAVLIILKVVIENELTFKELKEIL
jgi:hypothetical protein